MKIKLISGWSNPGGSTIHHINLTNLLNDNGYNCTFYGPHDYHLDKCKSDTISNITSSKTDTIISHFCQLPKTIPCNKHILSCHETNLFPLKKVDLKQYDCIHYVSEFQRQWHAVEYTHAIIPGIIDKITWKDPCNDIAGVIGSIDPHKRTHMSIERALKDGYKHVKLFGDVTDMKYFSTECNKYVQNNQASLMKHVHDKQNMYSQVSAVYSSSIRESFGLVQGECLHAGIPFHGLECNMRHDSDFIFDDSKILEMWEQVIND